MGKPEWIRVSLTKLTLQSCDVTVLDARGRGQALSVPVDSLRPDMNAKAEALLKKKPSDASVYSAARRSRPLVLALPFSSTGLH